MSKIYLVTEGDYSDYHVIGVYSTEQKANLVKSKMPDSEIEVYELDELADLAEQGYARYCVHMDNEGNVEKVELSDFGGSVRKLKGDNALYIWCYAKDEQHAIKIAAEKRFRLVAEGKL